MPNLLQSKVLENKKLNDKFHNVRFELLGEPFAFQVGQFVTMKVGEGVYRAYSVASHPQNLPEWEVVVDITPGGPGSTYLSRLKAGDIIESTNPRGVFMLEDDEADCIVMGATGCGIASIKPMTEELLKKSGKEVCLFWGLRFKEDLFFAETLEELKKRYPNFRYEIILSQPGEEWTGKQGHITEHLEEFLKEQKAKKVSVYLCGSGEMVKSVLKTCEELQFPCDRIYFEKYS